MVSIDKHLYCYNENKMKMYCNHLAGEERGAYLTVIVFSMSCGCQCSVYLRHGVVGWCAACSCDISRHTYF